MVASGRWCWFGVVLGTFTSCASGTNDDDKIESIDDSVSVGEEDENDSPLPTGGAKKPDDSPEEGDGNEKNPNLTPEITPKQVTNLSTALFAKRPLDHKLSLTNMAALKNIW